MLFNLRRQNFNLWYTEYANTFKFETNQLESIQKALDNRLPCVGSILIEGQPHAVLLDSISDTKFKFKNSFTDQSSLEVDVDAYEAPETFFFVHIEYKAV